MSIRGDLAIYRDLVENYQDAIEGKLRALGGDTQWSVRVGEYLAEFGIMGYRGNRCTCPLSVFLCQEFPNLQFYVYADHTVVRGDDGITITVDNPAHISLFIEQFDGGRWAELDAERAPIRLTPATVPGK